jgi:hypothetical protein
MREQIDEVTDWLKKSGVEAAITGSTMIGTFENADVDVFCYNQSSFTELIFAMYHNPKFLILDKLEKWKFRDYIKNSNNGSIRKLGLISLKFKWNTCVDVNVVFKKDVNSLFDVLSSFDMDIVCKGFDIKTQQYLDLRKGESDIANPNLWNKAFMDTNIWGISRILRQFSRIIKYHKRGYNTDPMVLKYKSMILDMQNTENIFNESFSVKEKIESVKINGDILIKIFDKWLESHEITDDEFELINKTIKQI